MKTNRNFCSSKFITGILKLNSFRNTVFTFMLLLLIALSSGNAVSQTQQILRLQVSNGINQDETVLNFRVNATDGIDDYDSEKMLNNNESIPEIYTMIGNEEFVINSMPPLTADKEILLAFKTGLAGTFTISNNQFEYFPVGTKVTLIDNTTGKAQIISDGSVYSFTSEAITKNDMFTVKIDLPDPVVINPNIIFTVSADNRIMITCNEVIVKGATVAVYNTTTGIFAYSGRLTNTITVINKKLPAGIYTVVVKNGGKVTSGRVIVR